MVFWQLLIFIVFIGGFLFWVNNRNYIRTIKSIASEGITATNYNELPGLVKTLPGTTAILSSKNYSPLYGNDKVKGIIRANGKILASLNFAEKDDDVKKRSAIINLNLEPEKDLADTILFASFEISGKIRGQGHQRSRMQLEIYDANGKVMSGPSVLVSLDSKETHLILRPTTSEPIPLGSAHENFDIHKVKKIAIRFIIGRYPDSISTMPTSGKILFDGIYSIADSGLAAKFFKKPNFQRITKENINPGYELRKLSWRRETNEFFVGLNYPWNNYGWDVGKNPYGQPENNGWSQKDNELKLRNSFTFLKEMGVTVVRIYVFFDLRTGLEYTDGKLTGFDQYVRKDIETIMRVAGETKMKIIPVLFDFGIADGLGQDKGLGEHPELIFGPEKANFLENLILPLLREMNRWNDVYNKPIFAVELMNEPENILMLLVPGYFESLKAWLQDLTNIIHNETSFKVTLGSRSIIDAQKWWNDLRIDVWQFHFYKYMLAQDEKWPLNLKRADIKFPGIIFCGELEPYDIEYNLNTVKENGYSGILFWSWNAQDGFDIKSSDKADKIFGWIKANQKEVK